MSKSALQTVAFASLLGHAANGLGRPRVFLDAASDAAAAAGVDAAKKKSETEFARMYAQLEEKLTALGDLPSVVDKLKAILKGYAGIDPSKVDMKGLVDAVDSLKATQATFTQRLRTSKSGLYVPGMEDEKFSLVRGLLGLKFGWDKVKGAGLEKEIVQAATAKARDFYAKTAITAGDDEALGGFIPDQVIADIIAAIYTRSVFMSLAGEGQTRVSVIEGLVGGTVKIPEFKGGVIAYWIGEGDAYAESLAKAGNISMTPKKLGALIRITSEMRDLGGYGFESLLRNDMIRALAKELDRTIVYGKGTADEPRGVFYTDGVRIFRAENGTVYTTLATAKAVSDWQGGELTFDGIDDMMLALEEDDITLDETAALISSPRYFKRLKRIKVDHYSGQASNQAYLLGLPMIPDSRLAEVIGPFDKSTQIRSDKLPGAAIGGTTTSVAAKFTDVVGGNLGEILVGRWFGLRVEDDGGVGSGFTSDHTYIKAKLHVDVAVRQKRAIIVSPDVKART